MPIENMKKIRCTHLSAPPPSDFLNFPLLHINKHIGL